MVGVTPKAGGGGQRNCFFLGVNLGGDFVVVTYPWTRTQRWSGFSDMAVDVVVTVKVDLASVVKVGDRQMAVRSGVSICTAPPRPDIVRERRSRVRCAHSLKPQTELRDIGWHRCATNCPSHNTSVESNKGIGHRMAEGEAEFEIVQITAS